LKENESVYIDASSIDFIDYDIFMTIEDFAKSAKNKKINVELNGITHRKLNYRKSNGIVSKAIISK
jgi:anti-anti-sigma regulatory factor